MSGGWGLVVAVVLGLVVSEFSELSPWLAQKLIHWAARVRYPTRVEELSALIAERPGKLFKLVTASVFACAALTYRVTHRKTVPVRSVTSRFWIGFGSALAAGALLIGEYELAFAIGDYVVGLSGASMERPDIIIFTGAIAAFVTAAEFLVPSRLPAGWATAVAISALVLTYSALDSYSRVDGELLIGIGWTAAVAGVSAACTIRLGNRLRFPVMAASSTVLGCGALTLSVIVWWTRIITPDYVNNIVELLVIGFTFGSSVGVGVLLWRVLCGRRMPQSSPERVPPTNDVA